MQVPSSSVELVTRDFPGSGGVVISTFFHGCTVFNADYLLLLAPLTPHQAIQLTRQYKRFRNRMQRR